MFKRISSIAFAFFLLFQTISMAEEEVSPTDTYREDQEQQALETNESTEDAAQEAPSGTSEEGEVTDPQEGLSEAEKEALEAEMAELRESGFYDEPVEE